VGRSPRRGPLCIIKMTIITKDICIEKICNLPLDFSVANKSSLTLMQESKFLDFHNDITKQDIKEYLFRHKNLIGNWEIWSDDKRTWGYYLSISPKKCIVGSIDENGKENYSKSFRKAEDACAEFILREVSEILDIKND
jgi:hypothetical protein